MTDLTNQFIGGYHFQWRIASGGMATVYLGQKIDDPNAPQVVLKVLHPDLAAVPVMRERFQREARIGQRLQHPRIVPVFELIETEDTLFMVMPYMAGGSLADRLLEDETLPWEEALRITKQIGEALDFAHDQGIIHRDVKPSNILFDEDGNAYLSDFGVAHQMDATTLTLAGFQPGTITYMAPEQLEGHTVSPATDQYALAVVLYYMLAGSPPYDSSTTAALSYHIVHKPPRPLPKRPDIPKDAAKVINKALAKKPAERYPDIAHFIWALEDLPLSSQRSMKPLLIGAAILVGVLLLAAAGFSLTRNPGLLAFRATPTPLPTPTVAPSATPTPTFTPLPTPTPIALATGVVIGKDSPTPTPTSTPSPTPLLSPTPTSTPPPTPTPTPTSTPSSSTPTRPPSNNPKPASPRGAQFDVALVDPAPGAAGLGFHLRWSASPLDPNLAFEPVIWSSSDPAEIRRFGMSPTGMVETTEVDANFQVLEGIAPLQLGPGHDYFWAVCVARKDPYQRLWCTRGRPFHYQSGGSSSGGSPPGGGPPGPPPGGGGGSGKCPPDC